MELSRAAAAFRRDKNIQHLYDDTMRSALPTFSYMERSILNGLHSLLYWSGTRSRTVGEIPPERCDKKHSIKLKL